MLSVHRKGKKHAANLERYYRNQKEIADLKLKRAHEQYLKITEQKQEAGDGHGDAAMPKLVSETHKTAKHALLKMTPYNSCVQRGKKEQMKSDSSDSKGKGLFFQSKKRRLKPGMLVNQATGMMSGAYVSKRLHKQGQLGHVETSTSISGSDKHSDASSSEVATTGGHAEDTLTLISRIPAELVHAPPPPPPPEGAVTQVPSTSTDMQTASPRAGDSCNSNNKQVKSKTEEALEDYDRDRRKAEVEYYVKMKSSGWIMDHRSGKWVKDENAEFDSDEEEPPLHPPS
ncbi:sodium channel modifier 1-like isoform X2 [Ptychodera flava]